MKDPIIKTVHQRTCQLIISGAELEDMMQQYAFCLIGFDPIATTVKIRFEPSYEGSGRPRYQNGMKCIVEMVEDRTMTGGA